MRGVIPLKVGIVIVTYNASKAVQLTLSSLSKAKNKIPYELVLVDNASQGKERKTIKNTFDQLVSQGNLSWKYIQEEKNLGFAGGNNIGINYFIDDESISHICLLNSDVIVGDYWLDRLVEKECDVVSAVTNKADSEQCVPIDYKIDLESSIDENGFITEKAFSTVNNFSQKWYQTWFGNIVQADPTFFCVLCTKKVISEVGLLDSNFFPGGFEDDDYCIRSHEKGFKTYLARDVFIHHWGSASFGQLEFQFFNKNALKNRRYLEEKHNFIWKKRFQMPVISYMHDIIYTLQGKNELSSQFYFNQLYLNSLEKMITHYQNEFINLSNQLLNSRLEIPVKLQQEIERITPEVKEISCAWDKITNEINCQIKKLPCDSSVIKAIKVKLLEFADLIYSIGECNQSIHQLLFNDRNQTNLMSGKLKRIFILFKKGIKWLRSVRKDKGIVIFGGYFYPEREKDGYFQRIKAIDSLFTDQWRIYVDHECLPGREGWYDRPAPNVVVLHIFGSRKRKWLLRLITLICVLRFRIIYFHSVLRMNDSKFGYLFYIPFIKKIIDIHGVVPEEFSYYNDSLNADLYNRYESIAVKKGTTIIVVSNAMLQHLEQKYGPIQQERVIIYPIFPHFNIKRYEKPYDNGKPIVIYAGGLHKWQQVPKMIDAINKTIEKCRFKFFCPQVDQLFEMLPESLLQNPSFIVGSKSYNELLQIYPDCHYGFILREDIVVNNVACPTKLVEYLAFGILPIVDSEKIGDFNSLGMQYISLNDFINGRLPDEATRLTMTENNYIVYKKLYDQHLNGALMLQKILTDTKTFADNQLLIDTLLPCDILVQVDNFLMGGLENVVLDLNEILIQRGFRVSLLVLGQPGVAVEKARDKGMPVYVTSFSNQLYESILLKTAPKVVISHYSTRGSDVCAKLNIPLIQIIHNTYIWFDEEQIRQFSDAARNTTVFVAVSEYAKEYSVKRLGVSPNKCLVIPNGIDYACIKKYDFAYERKLLREKYRLSDADFVFLSVGSITHQKNYLGMIRAFHRVVSDCPDVKLVIFGEIYEKQLYREIQGYISQFQLDNFIIYAGVSSKPYVYYAMADAFVHSAFFEGGPLVLIEAVASNLPIVISETGLAVHFKDYDGIALIPPPIDIFTYRGRVQEMKSNLEFEYCLAEQMKKIYINRQKPNFSDTVLEMFDKQHSYNLYVDLINHLIETGQVIEQEKLVSWMSIVSKRIFTGEVK